MQSGGIWTEISVFLKHRLAEFGIRFCFISGTILGTLWGIIFASRSEKQEYEGALRSVCKKGPKKNGLLSVWNLAN